MKTDMFEEYPFFINRINSDCYVISHSSKEEKEKYESIRSPSWISYNVFFENKKINDFIRNADCIVVSFLDYFDMKTKNSFRYFIVKDIDVTTHYKSRFSVIGIFFRRKEDMIKLKLIS